MDAAQKLVQHIETIKDFVLVDMSGDSYRHMGAILTDASLQAGIHYENVVAPRVQRLLRDYPEAQTTQGFLKLIQEQGVGTLLNWSGAKKTATLIALTEFFVAEGVNDEDALRLWLGDPDNLPRLMQIKGVGPKTVDYFKLLVGIPTVAVDVHLYKFLGEAGISVSKYEDAHKIIIAAADRLGVPHHQLDHSIWRYMSSRSQTRSAS